MFFPPVFHPRIEGDVREAVAYYEACSSGLGQRFKRTFYVTVEDLLVFPEKYAAKFGDVRTRLIRPFPYLIFYAVEGERIFVLTVQYAGRRPSYLRAMARIRRTG